jgi:hypothetical protein
VAYITAKQALRLRRKAKGECCECGRIPMPRKTRCKRCALQHNKDCRTLQAKYRNDYKCTTCGEDLMSEEIEQGYKKCITHREHITAGIRQWGRS